MTILKLSGRIVGYQKFDFDNAELFEGIQDVASIVQWLSTGAGFSSMI